MSTIVAPLDWKCAIKTSYHEEHGASTPFGTLKVCRSRAGLEDGSPWGSWKWGYCFAEYYDENECECASKAEGKRLAQEEWNKRILPCVKLAKKGE